MVNIMSKCNKYYLFTCRLYDEHLSHFKLFRLVTVFVQISYLSLWRSRYYWLADWLAHFFFRRVLDIWFLGNCQAYCIMIRIVRTVSINCWCKPCVLKISPVCMVNVSSSYMCGFIHQLYEPMFL